MKKGLAFSVIGVISLQVVSPVVAQSFMNLNFENANLTGYPPESMVPAANAFPGWTVSAQYIIHDDISLSGESISIIDTNSPNFTTVIQGNYFALLEPGNSPSSSEAVSLSQTGRVPAGTESITFWGIIGGMQVTFDGQPIAFNEIGNTANYNIYGANIPQFAGDTGQLIFNVPSFSSYATLDNIQFSDSPIPEPSSMALFLSGAALLGITRCERKG